MRRERRRFAVGAALVLAAALTPSCGSTGRRASTMRPAGVRFTAHVDNPWFPLHEGARYVYRGVKDGKASRDVVEVTHEKKTIRGAACVVVRDRLYLQGRLAERTADWYTQDQRGNVWYFGEDTAELDAQGRVTSKEGSWVAGRDGARPGIFMPAQPRIGASYRQEFYKGHAEDHFQIVSIRTPVRTPFAASGRALLTKETTPLEPRVVDHKYYVRGIGTVLEQTVKGGDERNALVGFRP